MFNQLVTRAARDGGWLASGTRAQRVLEPISRQFVAGASPTDVLSVVRRLDGHGIATTSAHLDFYLRERAETLAAATATLQLIEALAAAETRCVPEVSIKLTTLGASVPDGDQLLVDNVRTICQHATQRGVLVTIDMEDTELVDRTLDLAMELRATYPDLGVVLQADLLRTQADCDRLATTGSRVRLVKGSYGNMPDAFGSRHEIDLSYVRCMRTLMSGDGYPMLATHDSRLIDIGLMLANRAGRTAQDFEFQMLYNIRVPLQQQLITDGWAVRAYIPYGSDWMTWVTHRILERPANLLLPLRSIGRQL